MDLILFLTAAAHVFYTPFTKVEESFNLQSMHDILYLRHNFSEYDHHAFPGVVPRTFIGPLFISILSTPFIMFFESLRINKFWAQYVVRLVLAAVIAVAWNRLRLIFGKIFNLELRIWYTLITLTQFHFIFYMSRPLPNVMALSLVLFAIGYWMNRQMKHFIISSGMAILIFRSELIIFLGLLLSFDLMMKKITIDRILKIAVPAGIGILATTVIVDSFFWQRLVWPEGEVLWYNTILNKSGNWGTSPFLWYFYSALPRAMGLSLLFVPIGFYLEPRIRAITLAAVGFIFIYSFLPHKELRFIIYVFPVLNMAAACACHRFWINSTKSTWQGFLALTAGGHLLINVMITLFLLVVSSTNYPGGVALSRLHRLEANTPHVSVHIANLAAQSGVSRFLQIRDDWSYCKNESITYAPEQISHYTHLLVETKNKHNADLWNSLQESFETLEFVDCFNSIGIQYNSFFPIRIKTKPCIAILKRRKSLLPISKDEDVVVEEKYTQSQEKIEKVKIAHKKPKSKPKATESKQTENEKDIVASEEYKDSTTSNLKIEENESIDDVDGIVSNVDEPSMERITASVEEMAQTKEINFEELRHLAKGHVTKKTKATKLKIRKIIEQYYRSKGKEVENDLSMESPKKQAVDKKHTLHTTGSVRQSVKSIIKQERIKEMIEQIATMDLTRVCNLDKVSTKDCLKQVIDKLDEDGNKP